MQAICFLSVSCPSLRKSISVCFFFPRKKFFHFRNEHGNFPFFYWQRFRIANKSSNHLKQWNYEMPILRKGNKKNRSTWMWNKCPGKRATTTKGNFMKSIINDTEKLLKIGILTTTKAFHLNENNIRGALDLCPLQNHWCNRNGQYGWIRMWKKSRKWN